VKIADYMFGFSCLNLSVKFGYMKFVINLLLMLKFQYCCMLSGSL